MKIVMKPISLNGKLRVAKSVITSGGLHRHRALSGLLGISIRWFSHGFLSQGGRNKEQSPNPLIRTTGHTKV